MTPSSFTLSRNFFILARPDCEEDSEGAGQHVPYGAPSLLFPQVSFKAVHVLRHRNFDENLERDSEDETGLVLVRFTWS